MAVGSVQEGHLVGYLGGQGCGELIHPDPAVKKVLKLPAGCKCADVLGYQPNRVAVNRVVVAESKGTDLFSALRQLGNAAAGVLNLHPTLLQLRLLVYVPGLKKVPAGLSPGPGFLAGARLATNLYQLLEASSGPGSPARAVCELGPPWSQFSGRLWLLPVELYVEQD
jgi:hypothetical protein